MRLLVDAHALLWWLAQSPALSAHAREALSDVGNQLWLSAATVWEISIKQARGRLEAPDDLEEAVRSLVRPLPISLTHGAVAGRLPRHHADPFDRMLVAQAQIEGLTIVTRDREIQRYGVPVLAA